MDLGPGRELNPTTFGDLRKDEEDAERINWDGNDDQPCYPWHSMPARECVDFLSDSVLKGLNLARKIDPSSLLWVLDVRINPSFRPDMLGS